MSYFYMNSRPIYGTEQMIRNHKALAKFSDYLAKANI